MTVTQEVINQVRSLLADNNENEEDNFFTDEELKTVINKNNSLNYILYILFIQKSSKVLTEEGRIKAIKAGNEEVEKLTCIEMSNAFLAVAEYYKNLWLDEKEELSQFIY